MRFHRLRVFAFFLPLLFNSTPQQGDQPNRSYHQAVQLLARGDHASAAARFEAIIQGHPDFHRAYQRLVDARKADESLPSGARFFEALILVQPGNGLAHWGLGLIRRAQGRQEEAAAHLRNAAERRPDQPEVYESLVSTLAGLKRLPEAQLLIDEILRQHPSHAAAYHGRAFIHKARSEWDEGLRSIDRAIALRPDMYQSYYLKSWMLIRSAGFEEALKTFTTGLRHAEADGDFEFAARFLRNIGIVHSRLGQYSQAFESCLRAIETFRELGDQKWIEVSFGDLAMYHTEIGNYREAEKYYSEAIETAEQIGIRSDVARHVSNLGIVMSSMGRYADALRCYQRALAIDRELEYVRGQGYRLSNMGLVYHRLGDYEKARQTYREALELSRRIGDTRSESITQVNLGAVLEETSEYGEALALYRAALKNAVETGYKTVQAAALGKIGSINRRRGELDEAETHFARALSIAEEIQDPQLRASTLNSLGHLSFLQDRYHQALDYHRQALEIGEKARIADVHVEAHTGLAQAFEALGRLRRARENYEAAIREVEAVRGLLVQEEHKLSFMERQIEAYERLINLLTTLHADDPTGGFDRAAFLVAERAKARALLDIIQQGRAFEFLTDFSGDFRQRLLANERRLQDAYTRRWQLGEERATAEGMDLEIDFLKLEQSRLMAEVWQRYPQYHALSNPTVFSAHDVQRRVLCPGDLLVEYFVGADRTYLWAVTRDRLFFRTIDLTREELAAHLARVSPIFRPEESPGQTTLDHRWANIRPHVLKELFAILLGQPVGHILDEVTRLIIIPDDVLHYFPFEMLVTQAGGETVHYLAERIPVSYASSASLLNPDIHQRRTARHELLAFGNPQFDMAPDPSFRTWLNAAVTTSVALFRGDHLAPLPHAEAEVLAIARCFKDSQVVTGRGATEERFKREAGDYRLLHLATHNITDDRQPMYSKIMLATDPDGREDGYLQTYEIFNLHLNSELVVLSACNTGLGRLRRGEGLVGMTRAFMYAGASNLVVSLWPVNDKSTELLMERFYQELAKGVEKSVALQRAKQALIGANDWKRDPFYWGPFVLIGGVGVR